MARASGDRIQALQLDFELRPAAGHGCGQVIQGRPVDPGQRLELRKAGLALAVLHERQLGGGQPGLLRYLRQGEAALLAEVAEPSSQ